MRVSSIARILKSKYLPIYPGRISSPNVQESSIPVINPANGETLAEVVTSSPEDVKRCVAKANDTFKSGVWSEASSTFRSSVLAKLGYLLEEHTSELAVLETLQTGRAIREMRAQLARLPEWLHYFSAAIRVQQGFVAPTTGSLHNFVSRIPLGVVAQITPFNHPLLIAVKKLAPALAMGNSVIVKPSEHTPISILEFFELALEAGVPEGVLSVLPGPGNTTGVELISNPSVKKIDITSGTQTGRDVGKIAGGNLVHYTAELGGKAPVIVFNDADLGSAVNGAAFASFIASGQTCVSGTRILVQDDIYDAFIQSFLKKVDNITVRMGDPMNPESTMGCLISKSALRRIDNIIRDGSAKVVCGGRQMTGLSPLDGFNFDSGCFYPPTVLTDVDLQSKLWHEELFGPVVIIQKFRSDKVGIQLANDCQFGLGASVWTTDLGKAHWAAKAIEAGIVWINTHHRNDPSSPWGGLKASGLGRENGLEALDSYSQSKSIIMNTAFSNMPHSDDWFAMDGEGKRYG